MSEAERADSPRRQWRRSLGLLLAFILIIGNGGYALVTLYDLRDATMHTRRGSQVLHVLQDLQQRVRDRSRLQRNYLLTGDDAFRQSSIAADHDVATFVARLSALTADSPAQQQSLARLRQELDDRQVELARGIEQRQQLGVSSITPDEVASFEQSVARIRATILELQTGVQQAYDQRIAVADQRASIALVLLAADTLSGLGLIGAIFWLMRGEAEQRDTLVRARTTELAQREAELRTSEARLRLALEGAGLGLWERDIPRGTERLDARAAEVVGSMLPADIWLLSDGVSMTRWDARVHPEDRAARRAAREAMLVTPDAMQSLEYRVQRMDGGWLWISAVSTTVERDSTTGLPIRVLSVVQDITRRKQTELELQHTQRMEAIGQLTGGLAHDFNNLLGVIIGNVELLGDALQDNPEHAEMANEILESGLRGAELTRRLLAFARRQPLQPQLIDLNEHLPGQVAMLQRMIGEAVQVSLRLSPGLGLTRADPAQVADTVLNLAINSRDAMPHGGQLTIETSAVELDAEFVAHDPEFTAGDYVVLSVTDTGVGMSPEVMARAIEPFFTTKGVGQGSGLGLSMIYGFAKQSGGHLRLYSEPGFGTTVKLYLPRVYGIPPAAAIVAAGNLPGGNETILLVDDNPELRTIAARHLSGLGYQVRAVQDGIAALKVLQSCEPIDLLFTDIVMPGNLSGYQLAEAARALRPALPVLFSSGFANAPRRTDASEPDKAKIIRKPYRRQELAVKLRAALDEANSKLWAGAGR